MNPVILRYIRKILFSGIRVAFPNESPRQKLARFLYAQSIEELFKVLDIRTVIDVGANRGQYRDFIRNHICFQGIIISFEPIKELSTYLRHRSIQEDRWIVYDVALGAKDCDVDLNFMKDDRCSSLHMPLHSEIFEEGNEIDHVEPVSMRRLDGILGEIRRTHDLGNIFLKLDTQGHDLEVVKGISDFTQIAAIQSEVSSVPIYENIPTIAESLQFFKERRFEVAGMFPVNHDTLNRVVEFDCVMVKSRGTSPTRIV